MLERPPEQELTGLETVSLSGRLESAASAQAYLDKLDPATAVDTEPDRRTA